MVSTSTAERSKSESTRKPDHDDDDASSRSCLDRGSSLKLPVETLEILLCSSVIHALLLKLIILPINDYIYIKKYSTSLTSLLFAVSFKTNDIITDLHLEKMAEVAIEFADRHIIQYSCWGGNMYSTTICLIEELVMMCDRIFKSITNSYRSFIN